jgi:dienelactone hydrolase
MAMLAEPVAAFGPDHHPGAASWIKELTLTLPNGDEADVYAPRVPPRLRSWLEDRFAFVAVLQGALVDKSNYRALGRQLARQGFVVVVPNHLRSFPPLYPDPELFSEVSVVSAVSEAMIAADTDPLSPLYRIVDTATMGAVGHSLGGFAALHALAGECSPGICTEPDGVYAPPPALQAVAVYGANLADAAAGTVIDLDTAQAPVALLQGTLDGVAVPEEAEMTCPTLEPPAALITLDGANHYGICDRNNPVGAIPDPIDPTLNQRVARFQVARWTGLWLRAHLRDDPWAWFWLEEVGGSFTGVVTVASVCPPESEDF